MWSVALQLTTVQGDCVWSIALSSGFLKKGSLIAQHNWMIGLVRVRRSLRVAIMKYKTSTYFVKNIIAIGRNNRMQGCIMRHFVCYFTWFTADFKVCQGVCFREYNIYMPICLCKHTAWLGGVHLVYYCIREIVTAWAADICLEHSICNTCNVDVWGLAKVWGLP